MSYDITFKAKLEGVDKYVTVGDCEANIIYNVQKIITLSTGLPWINCENNGFCKDVIPHIKKGLEELVSHPKKYKPYEAENGRGTVEGTARFFRDIIKAWDRLGLCEGTEVANVATFWIE